MITNEHIFHKCPNCGFIVSDLQFKYARFDYPCPVCEVKNLSSFEIVKQK